MTSERGLWVEGVSDGGAPMHAEANGWYFYSDNDGQGLGRYPWLPDATPHARAARYLRIPADELPTGMDRAAFSAFIETLRPLWATQGPAIAAANAERERAEDRAERNRNARIARGVTIISAPRDPSREEQADRQRDPGATFWTVNLRYQGRSMSTPYFMGSAHHGEPEAADVLGSLLMDALGLDQASDFADWSANYGYENDAKARRTYAAVQSLSKKVKKLLGDEYATRAELASQR